MLGRDGIAGVVCLALSIALLALSVGLPHPPLLPVGPAFYPRIVLGVIAALSVALVVEDVVARRREAAAPRPAPQAPKAHLRVVLTFAVFGLYALALPEIGFRLTTLAFVALLQIVLEPPRSIRDWGRIAGIALATVVVCYVV